MLEIINAKYAGDYKIHLTFNNGKKGIANLKQPIFDDHRPIFSKLREESYFKDFSVENSTVVWSDELDLAAEYLFFLAFKDDPEFQEKFRKWGYIN